MSVEEDNVTVLDRGEHLTIVGADDDPGQVITARQGRRPGAASEHHGGDASENNRQRDAEEIARTAEIVHKKVENFHTRFAVLGRQQLDAAIEVGHHLLKAKEILGHGNFKNELKRWSINRTITFSDRSARRYMRLADHAEALKVANVANLREAEYYIAGLKPGEETVDHGDAEVSTPSEKHSTELVIQVETRVLNDMRRLERDEQRSFLEGLIARLNDRLEALEA